MRDALSTKVKQNESDIVNLNDSIGFGTYWVAYAKQGNNATYFDSFDNLRPPKELERYLGSNVNITYNFHSH